MTTLNSAQINAIECDAPFILCVAGPGSGKTRVIIERILRGLHDGKKPAEIVCLTYTNAAADNIAERLRKGFFGEQQVKLGFCGTLHSFCLRMIQTRGEAIGFGPNPTVLDAEQADLVLDQCVKEMQYNGALAQLRSVMQRGPGAFPRGENCATLAELTAKHYFQTLKRVNLLTFDTMLYYGGQLAAGEKGYQHLLVDEVQDSTNQDWGIYRALPIENKFFVGDSDQAIFGFRGGSVEAMEQTAKNSATVLPLESNYRCDRLIAEAAQRLVEHNPKRIPKSTLSATGFDGAVQAIPFANPAQELAWLTSTLSGYEAGVSCAVLLRTNVLVDQYATHLQGAGLQVARPERPDLPADWTRAKATLAWMNDPDNDALAIWLVAPVDREKVRLEAAAAGVSISEKMGWPSMPFTVHEAVNHLARFHIGPESIGLASMALGHLPPESGVSELLLRLSEMEHVNDKPLKGIVVSTMHSAKGTEYDVVVCPAFEDAIVPGDRKGTVIEEERRLAYVAWTRARHELYVTWAGERQRPYGDIEPSKPSRFIKEGGLK